MLSVSMPSKLKVEWRRSVQNIGVAVEGSGQSVSWAGERVVIEGVETPQDYAICRMSGADAVQGFLFEQAICRVPLNHC